MLYWIHLYSRVRVGALGVDNNNNYYYYNNNKVPLLSFL
jgi:hypothetical protein